jgi:hypothetical protein
MFLDADNGYSFSAGNYLDLQRKLEQIMRSSDDKLWEMAESSYHKGIRLKLDDWVNIFNTMAK